jgi:T5SS/PEP-CTERM-associated repeat protein
LAIADGGTVTCRGVDVLHGSISVGGTGSLLDATTGAILLDGNATVSVSGGGRVITNIGTDVAGGNTSTGITVSGAGSSWSTGNVMLIGAYGVSGYLTVENGGSVDIGQQLFIGEGGNGVSSSSVTFRGPGTTGTVGTVGVGGQATGTLLIENGAQVSALSVAIGTTAYREAFVGTATANGTVTVTGAGTRLESAGISIGQLGQGTLTIENGALTVASAVGLAADLGTQGRLGLASGGTLVTEYLMEGSGQGLTGAATIELDGGIVRASTNATEFLRDFESGDVQLMAGGGTIDTNDSISGSRREFRAAAG